MIAIAAWAIAALLYIGYALLAAVNRDEAVAATTVFALASVALWAFLLRHHGRGR